MELCLEVLPRFSFPNFFAFGCRSPIVRSPSDTTSTDSGPSTSSCYLRRGANVMLASSFPIPKTASYTYDLCICAIQSCSGSRCTLRHRCAFVIFQSAINTYPSSPQVSQVSTPHSSKKASNVLIIEARGELGLRMLSVCGHRRIAYCRARDELVDKGHERPIAPQILSSC